MSNVKKDIKKDIDKDLKNKLLAFEESSDALKVLINNLNADSSAHMYLLIVDAVLDISYISGLEVMEIMIEHSVYYEKVLMKMISFLRDNPYILDDNKERFKEVLNHICKNHYKYSFEALISLADCLEYLFACGNMEIRKNITELYRYIPGNTGLSEEYSIHKELVCVYEYNHINKQVLYSRVQEVYNHCKESKRKYMYGKIYYYFAVLDILSKSYDGDINKNIDKSCSYDYEMAYTLRNHYSDILMI